MHNVPHVNIVIFSQPITAIQDQVDFLAEAFKALEADYQISHSLHPSYLNLLIEGGTQFTSLQAEQFCAKNRQKVAMVLTEHL